MNNKLGVYRYGERNPDYHMAQSQYAVDSDPSTRTLISKVLTDFIQSNRANISGLETQRQNTTPKPIVPPELPDVGKKLMRMDANSQGYWPSWAPSPERPVATKPSILEQFWYGLQGLKHDGFIWDQVPNKWEFRR